jgi:(1->4)-alpha-D-glucan 1-alpha-D-glucosylmutase
MLNALAAVVLKCTAPGIPDFYQGCELPALSLVDPDNRRPVDFEGNARALAELEAQIAAGSAAEVLSRLLQGWQDGRLKLLVTHRLLQLRSTHADALAGDYLPLAVQGGRAEHVAAFARLAGDAAVITIATRWPATLCGGETRPALGAIWEDTALALAARLPPGRYTDVLTGRVLVLDPGAPGASLQLSALLQDLPCCVLAASVASG